MVVSLLLPIQILLIVFILFAASRAYLRFKGGSIHFGGLIFWFTIWGAAIIATIYPEETQRLAQLAGIGRGADVVIYASIALLFYLVFRLHVMLEDIRTEISKLIREISLSNAKKKKK